MTYIAANLRQAVIERAQDRCEYCRLSQAGQEATFHIDHVTPVAIRGATIIDNLALACVSCSLRKGARETATDPITNSHAAIFNPRTNAWTDHFRWEGPRLVGLTPSGRATIHALELNRELIVAIRNEEIVVGRHPG